MGSLVPQQRALAAVSNAAYITRKENRTRSVMFVCWGNLCRSPAGASVLQEFLEESKIRTFDFYIDSAGVEVVASNAKPTFAMRWAAFRRGYQLKQRARRIRRPELDEFDLVIALDRKVLHSLSTFHHSPTAKIKLLSDFLPPGMPRDVPDPMFRTTRTCNKVFDMLELACPQIVTYLCKSCSPVKA